MKKFNKESFESLIYAWTATRASNSFARLSSRIILERAEAAQHIYMIANGKKFDSFIRHTRTLPQEVSLGVYMVSRLRPVFFIIADSEQHARIVEEFFKCGDSRKTH